MKSVWYIYIFTFLYFSARVSDYMWLFALRRVKSCPLQHTNTHSRTRRRTLFTERHANWTIGARCKRAACWFDSSAQTGSELWTAEETLIWMETSCLCLLVQLPATLTKTASVCTRYRMTNCGNARHPHVCDLCYCWRKGTKPLFFFLNTSVYPERGWFNRTLIHIHTFPHIPHIFHTAGLFWWQLHCTNWKGSKPRDCVLSQLEISPFW